MSIVRFLALNLVLIFSPILLAESEIKGVGDVAYFGWGSSPSSDDVDDAKSKARLSALSRWASKQGSSFLKNYDAMRDIIEKNANDFIISESIVSDKKDKKNKNYRVVLKIALDDVRLINFVNDSSAVSNTAVNDRSYMTFVFLSRRQASVKSYDEKIHKRIDASVSEQGSEIENYNAGGVAFESSTNKTQTVTSGGSRTKKADIISYDVASSDEINIAMSRVFSTSGFEIVEAEYLEEETDGLLSVEEFKADYRRGNDISGATRRNAAKGAKMVDVPYIAIGTLDIGAPETDSASGLVSVSVTVTGKVISVKKRFPKTVAAVGPVQISGLGQNQTVAERNALKKASEKAATELINQLNSKSVM